MNTFVKNDAHLNRRPWSGKGTVPAKPPQGDAAAPKPVTGKDPLLRKGGVVR